jgi:hypothetical protein
MDTTLADFIRKYGAEAFAVLGALVGLSFIEKLTIVVAVAALCAGFAFGVVSAPIITHYADPPAQIRDYVLAGAALVMALVGFVIAGAIHASAQHMKVWAPDYIRRLIERKTGG